jgi:hypothetical protein
MSGYDINEGVEVAVTFTDRNGVLRDPSSWKLERYSPSGVKTTFTYPADVAVLPHDSVGKFHYDLLFTEKGTWIVRATSLDGTLPSVAEQEYFVREPRF